MNLLNDESLTISRVAPLLRRKKISPVELTDAFLDRISRFQPRLNAFITMTPDLDAAFPATAARSLGWNDVALLDAQAPGVAHDVPRCIRVLIHWNTERVQEEIRHVYLRDARALRPDRAQNIND